MTTYNETVRDTYFWAAKNLYAAGAASSEEDAAGYLRHGKILENLGHEHWVATPRQETALYKLRSRCEANTTEGREDAEEIMHGYLVGHYNPEHVRRYGSPS